MLKIEIHEFASLEFDEAIDWYENQAKGLGERFKNEVVKRIKSARNNPSWYPQESKNLHKLYIPKFPYKVIFTYTSTHLTIWAICHLHRKPRYWKSRIKNKG